MRISPRLLTYTSQVSSQSPSSPLDMDPFSRLPADLRLKIFAFTHLVAADRSGRKTGVHILDSDFSDPPAHYMYCTGTVRTTATVLSKFAPS